MNDGIHAAGDRHPVGRLGQPSSHSRRSGEAGAWTRLLPPSWPVRRAKEKGRPSIFECHGRSI